MSINEEARRILAAAKEASAIVPIDKAVPPWSLSKRWDTIDSFKKMQIKLEKMGVHSVVILLSENPKRGPSRKLFTKGCLTDFVHKTDLGTSFALKALSLNPKC